MTTYIRNEDVAFRMLGDEAVLLNPEDNQIHLLNEVASFTWDKLKEPHSFDELLDSICDEFDVAQEKARSDLQNLSKQLLEKGLIRDI